MSLTVKVHLESRSYAISIGTRLLDQLGALCRHRKLGPACLVVSDANVDAIYGKGVEESLKSAGFAVGRAVIPAGENSKSQEQLSLLYSKALESGLDRTSFVVALGGGVVGDLAGYLAATFLRGIAYIQVPTSLLAMVDSSVGGKTGINLPQGKNLVGAFHQPAVVVADAATLKTLPMREYVSGLAEVVKYGVIRDAAFFNSLEKGVRPLLNADPGVMDSIIARCCEIKADIVSRDEREGGLRAILNFGHTMGHAIEQVAGYGKYLHGEAIAMGMVFAARLSAVARGLVASEGDRVVALLRSLGLPVTRPGGDWEALRAAMSVDKKSAGRSLRFVLADRIGQVTPGCEVTEKALRSSWDAWPA